MVFRQEEEDEAVAAADEPDDDADAVDTDADAELVRDPLAVLLRLTRFVVRIGEETIGESDVVESESESDV